MPASVSYSPYVTLWFLRAYHSESNIRFSGVHGRQLRLGRCRRIARVRRMLLEAPQNLHQGPSYGSYD